MKSISAFVGQTWRERGNMSDTALKAEVRRTATGDSGTFGLLTVYRGDSVLTLATAELPWRDNVQQISCVPIGTYDVTYTHSPAKHRKLYRLANVKKREGVLIHAGNWAGDTAKGLKSNVQGCILVGMQKTKLDGQDAVDKSQAALKLLDDFTSGLPLKLTILEDFQP
jgi:hypothetical protein